MSTKMEVEVPKTKTPSSVVPTLLLLAVAMGIFFWFIFGVFWGVTILLLTIAFTTDFYTQTVQGFDAHIVLDHLTGVQRTIFQGVHFKLPWEEVQDEMIDLKRDVKEVVSETYASADALMEARYIVTLRPDASGDDAGEKIVLYNSFEPEVIRMEVRSMCSMMLSDYFSDKPGKDLLNKRLVNKEVFETEEGTSEIEKFEEEHGSEVTVIRLEDVDFDKRTQKFRDLVSEARSFDEAVSELIKDGNGMTREEAVKVAKLMAFKDVTETNWNISAPDLKNMTHLSILGGVGGGDKKKGEKK